MAGYLKFGVLLLVCRQVLGAVGDLPYKVADNSDDDGPVSFRELVTDKYDKLRPPRDGDNPVTVKIFVSVLTIRNVDERELSYDMDIFFHQYWKDNRLRLPDKYQKEGKVVLDNKWLDDMWTPDTFFKNSRDGKLHNIIIPYMYITLSNDSEVFMASRLGLKLNCEMDLRLYPHDVQECEISIMSLQHTIDNVKLVWKNFKLTKNIMLPQFDVTGNSHENCTKVYDIGTYSCLVGKVRLSRRLGYFLLSRYVPSILIVVMSFVSFWIPPLVYPARIALCVTSLLTIVTLQYTISIPSVSYIMAINVWIIGCIVFVFSTLLQYTAIVATQNYLSEHKQRGDYTDSKREMRVERIVLMLDKASRVTFPLLFCIFCVFYCISYGGAASS